MKPLILCTYRDRLTHLNTFIAYMARYFSHLPISVLEQVDKGPWNKGLLFNAGYRELASEFDYIIFHDIDFLPDITVDYGPCTQPTLLATECSQFGYGQCYPGFFGGVTAMDKEHYELVNGYSNKFRGWGGEDDHINNKFIHKGITPQRRLGNRFENFIHPRLDVLGKDKDNPDYLHNLQLATGPLDYSDGLDSAVYTVEGRDIFRECIRLRINTTGI